MELQKKLDELGAAFEEFKKANDQRLKEIAAKGYASSETEQKVEKMNAEIGKLEGKIAELTAALNRTGNGDEKKSEREGRLAEYKEAAAKYMRRGVELPQELKDWARKDMSVDSDIDGGFFVNPEMSSEIVAKVFESNPIRQLASVQTISTDGLEILQDLDESDAGWVSETQSRTGNSGTPQIKKILIPVHELQASPKATQKLLDDAAVNVEAWLAGKVAEKFARSEAAAFLNGDGVMKPKGITAYADGTGFGQVERKETAANNALTADELIEVQVKLKEPYQVNASWLINREMIGYIRKLKDIANGNYLWQPGLTVGVPGTLLGRPVYMATELPASITAGADTIIYGDIRAGYQIVDRVGIRVLRDPYTSKPFVIFYTTKRVGGAVKNFEAIKILKQKA